MSSACCALVAVASPENVDSGAGNRAPLGVFIVLGLAVAFILVLLYLAVPISGDDLTYGGTKYYSGPFGGIGTLGGFGGFGGF